MISQINMSHKLSQKPGAGFLAFLLFSVIFLSPSAFAANNLTYMGEREMPTETKQAEPASSRLSPIQNSSDYSTEFSRYSSFMQSPYAQGGAGTPMKQSPAAGYVYAPSGYGPNTDPYMASEVSPYSKYTPYVEVVGEGSDYTLGIDDVVTVIVREQPDFSGRFVVDPEGNIQYNFVGDISAEGKTKGELKADISEALKKYVRYPEVAVMISAYRSKAVYVLGRVNSPGKYAMRGDKITVKEAVVAAGLPTGDGALKRVYVIRPSDKTESGEMEEQKVDLKKLLFKGDASEDFMLQPGDTIVVNQRYFDKFVNTFSRLVGPLFQAAAVYELGFGSPEGGFLNNDSN